MLHREIALSLLILNSLIQKLLVIYMIKVAILELYKAISYLYAITHQIFM